MRALQPTTVSLICCFLVFNFFSRISEAGKHPEELFCERKVIQHLLPICIHILRYTEKYFKQRTVYSASHPGSYNPSVITNQEAHMIYGNMEGTGNSARSNEKGKTTKKAKTISDYFSVATPRSGVEQI